MILRVKLKSFEAHTKYLQSILIRVLPKTLIDNTMRELVKKPSRLEL